SRDSAGAQLALQLAAVRLVLTQGAIDVFVALAGGIAPESLAAATGTVYHPPASAQAADMGTLSDDGLTVHLVAGALGNLLEDVDLVLSQGGAGTATQQAVSMGLPVVSTADPDDRPKRQRDDRALLGPSWIPA